MPLFSYTCDTCGKGVSDVLVLDEAKALHDTPCITVGCSGKLRRADIYRTVHTGPVYSNVEALERQLLSPKMRARGMRITGPKDVEALHQDMYERHGLVPVDPESQLAKDIYESELDDARMLERLFEQELKHGTPEEALSVVHALDDKLDVQEASGLTDAQYVRWRNDYDAVAGQLEAGEHAGPGHLSAGDRSGGGGPIHLFEAGDLDP